MKTTLLLLSSLLLLALSPARADVSIEVFYDSLESHGEWVDIDGYGYCWTPGHVEADWRPYTDGSWVYTDSGWTWVSDEPYGWAVYHYGRWLRTESVGWVWVPGEEWGPAWVSWRRSPEYVGWAPLPPEARFSRSVGISSRIDVEFDIGPSYYAFVPVRSFGAERLRTVIVEPRRNVTIINQTRNITNITYVNQTVINRGPDYDMISRESERPIRRLKLNRRTDFAADERRIEGGARISGDSLEVSAPRIERSAEAKPGKVARKIGKAEVDRGWKGAGSAEEIEQVRARMKQEDSEPEATAEESDRKGRKEAANVAEETPAPPAMKEPRARDRQESAEEAAPEQKAAGRAEESADAVEEKGAERMKRSEKIAKERKAAPPAAEREVSEEPVRRPKTRPEVEAAPAEAPESRVRERRQPELPRQAPERIERKREPSQPDVPKVRKEKQEKAPRAPEAARPSVPAPVAAPEVQPAEVQPAEVEKPRKERGKDKKDSD